MAETAETSGAENKQAPRPGTSDVKAPDTKEDHGGEDEASD